jgi:hypothetical protein
MWLFLVAYVLATTGVPIWWHHKVHGVVSPVQACLAFFLGLNAIVCLWEISLFFEIELIAKKNKVYEKQAKGRALSFALDFFFLDVNLGNVFTSKLWCEVWAYYSVFDRSYANRESFGFFVDVGNGWTTLPPTLAFLVGMTAHGGGDYAGSFLALPFGARALGVLGLLSFYQEFYGTCVYFLSFVLNKRYAKLTPLEVGIFVCFTNGLWFVFPLLGMKASWDLVMTGDYSTFM